MGIAISRIRIENFRSIEYLKLSLSMINVLIGANNCGKSNFLRAVNVALGQNKIVSSDDIYIAKDEVLDHSKCATIDIMLRPKNEENEDVDTFSDFWIGVFTDAWITTGDPLGDYVGIRTILQYDAIKNDYVIVRKQITNWGESVSSATVSRRKAFTGDMNTYITQKLWPQYLMLYFSRSEFDRYARFCSWGSARETFDWSEMCDVQIPIPDIEVQKSISEVYSVYIERKRINEQLKIQIKNICPLLIKGSLEDTL